MQLKPIKSIIKFIIATFFVNMALNNIVYADSKIIVTHKISNLTSKAFSCKDEKLIYKIDNHLNKTIEFIDLASSINAINTMPVDYYLNPILKSHLIKPNNIDPIENYYNVSFTDQHEGKITYYVVAYSDDKQFKDAEDLGVIQIGCNYLSNSLETHIIFISPGKHFNFDSEIYTINIGNYKI